MSPKKQRTLAHFAMGHLVEFGRWGVTLRSIGFQFIWTFLGIWAGEHVIEHGLWVWLAGFLTGYFVAICLTWVIERLVIGRSKE
jgi:Zn-dependent protease